MFSYASEANELGQLAEDNEKKGQMREKLKFLFPFKLAGGGGSKNWMTHTLQN